MSNLMIIRSVFCPNDKYFQISINNIINTCLFVSNFENDSKPDLLIIGWIRYNSYEGHINELLKIYINKFNSIIIKLWYTKYVKYKILNKMKKYALKYNYMF